MPAVKIIRSADLLWFRSNAAKTILYFSATQNPQFCRVVAEWVSQPLSPTARAAKLNCAQEDTVHQREDHGREAEQPPLPEPRAPITFDVDSTRAMRQRQKGKNKALAGTWSIRGRDLVEVILQTCKGTSPVVEGPRGTDVIHGEYVDVPSGA